MNNMKGQQMNKDLLQWHVAAIESIATIQMAVDRLNMNNMNGEEDEYLEDCETALKMLRALPINRAAVRAGQ